jgi:hypothetical protein
MRETNTPGWRSKTSAPRRACKKRSGCLRAAIIRNGGFNPPVRFMALSKRHSTHSGVESIWDAKPRVVVAIATRPGAIFSDPPGIKKQADKVESLKALAQSLISPCPAVRRANRIAPRWITVTIIQVSGLFPASIAARLQVNPVSSILAILNYNATFTPLGRTRHH